MSKVKTCLAFLLGAVVGGVGTWYYVKDIYANQSELDISSAKDAFHIYEKKLKAEIEELKKKIASEEKTDQENQVILVNEKIKDKGDVVEYAKGKYTQYSPSISSEKLEPERMYVMESPYVISPDEFGEYENYTKVSLTYYADGILADENGVVVDDVEEIVGDALDHFGEYEDDSVFCRSNPKRCDYEILKDYQKYADIRKLFPPII